jgi:cytochrome P450
MDPPDHSRLRRLLSRAFTRRAVAQLEHRIRSHARTICDRVFTGPRGECDFAKDVAADLPLLTLADVLGVPHQDRWVLFDWSNRVIGYQDPDYASSAEFDPAAGTPMARWLSSRTCSGCSRWPATRPCATACRVPASRCLSTRAHRTTCAPIRR